jgi:hypothetical protein
VKNEGGSRRKGKRKNQAKKIIEVKERKEHKPQHFPLRSERK